MNIIEALKLLQEGKRISHQDSPNTIFELFDNNTLTFYRNDSDKGYYNLYFPSGNKFNIDCSTMLNGWNLVTQPLPVKFDTIKYHYDRGMTIKRIGTDKMYNNKNLVHQLFSMDDMEACDWEVVE